VGLEDRLTIRADVVAHVAIGADLVRWDVADGQAVVWVAEQNDRVDEVGSSSVGDEELKGVVHDLAALAVAADAELGLGALGQGLLDELCDRQ